MGMFPFFGGNRVPCGFAKSVIVDSIIDIVWCALSCLGVYCCEQAQRPQQLGQKRLYLSLQLSGHTRSLKVVRAGSRAWRGTAWCLVPSSITSPGLFTLSLLLLHGAILTSFHDPFNPGTSNASETAPSSGASLQELQPVPRIPGLSTLQSPILPSETIPHRWFLHYQVQLPVWDATSGSSLYWPEETPPWRFYLLFTADPSTASGR